MIRRYSSKGRSYWRIDAWVKYQAGMRRFRRGMIPTEAQAKAVLAKELSSAYEGRAFDKAKPQTLTVSQAWGHWSPVDKRDNDSHGTTKGRSAHLLRHIGPRLCASLTRADVDAYRAARAGEDTQRGGPPSPATLDREVALLKRCLSYAVACGRLAINPLAGCPLLNKPNTRDVTITDEAFERLISAKALPDWMRPVLLTAFDTGMRIGEVLRLEAKRLDLAAGVIVLRDTDTKAERPRIVALQGRTVEALRAMPRVLSRYVFANPTTRKPRTYPRKGWRSALKEAGLEGAWVHDLRRSFITLARKRGAPESVIMRQSGHKTRAVFARYNIVDDADLRELARTMEAGRVDAVVDTAARHDKKDGKS